MDLTALGWNDSLAAGLADAVKALTEPVRNLREQRALAEARWAVLFSEAGHPALAA